MRFLLSDLAAAVDGRLIGADRSIDGVSTDSRSVEAGQLFVPLVAERDGHDFVETATTAGAAAYLTSRSDVVPGVDSDGSAVLVGDTSIALTRLGAAARDRLNGPVIGITGSVGKTSVKDLTRAAASARGSAWASAASFNNEIGVPLTLANTPDGTDVTIVEMGARGIGHIAELCAIAKPTIGLVTCVALAHSELFGSLEGVATGKGELVEALPVEGTAVLNADDSMVAAMADRTVASVVTFGADPGADIRFGAVSLDRLLRPRFTVESDWGTAEVSLAVRGAHMAQNATAALAATLAAGIPFDAAIDGLAASELSPWRMEVAEGRGGVVVINDAYNANPTSMRAAFESLAEVPVDNKTAVVGVMAELGAEGPAEHLAVAAEASERGIRVIAIDAPAYGDAAAPVADHEQALALLGELGSADAVLVKGSRVAGLELLAARLIEA